MKMKFHYIIFAGISLLLSCTHSHNDDDRMCTMEYRTLTITVVDSLSRPVLLDHPLVLKTGTGIMIDFTLENPGQDSINRRQGIYTLFTDGKMALTSRNGTEFRFQGQKDGTTIVNEPYIIANDGCHINLISGRMLVVIP